ncbi:MAG: hypothetical protein WBD47_19975 [Phormidesmis sp.]
MQHPIPPTAYLACDLYSLRQDSLQQGTSLQQDTVAASSVPLSAPRRLAPHNNPPQEILRHILLGSPAAIRQTLVSLVFRHV